MKLGRFGVAGRDEMKVSSLAVFAGSKKAGAGESMAGLDVTEARGRRLERCSWDDGCPLRKAALTISAMVADLEDFTLAFNVHHSGLLKRGRRGVTHSGRSSSSRRTYQKWGAWRGTRMLSIDATDCSVSPGEKYHPSISHNERRPLIQNSRRARCYWRCRSAFRPSAS